MFVRRAQIGHDMFTEAPKVESVAVGEKPALITEAAHLLDTDEFDRAGQQRVGS